LLVRLRCECFRCTLTQTDPHQHKLDAAKTITLPSARFLAMILPDNRVTRERAARTIAAGGLIAFRTDTFYGLGADPFNPPAVRQIIDLKGREGKPILLLISDLEEADRFIVDQTEQFKLLARSLWPGPLTIVSTASAGLSNDLTAGTGTIGVRLPHGDFLRDLIR